MSQSTFTSVLKEHRLFVHVLRRKMCVGFKQKLLFDSLDQLQGNLTGNTSFFLGKKRGYVSLFKNRVEMCIQSWMLLELGSTVQSKRKLLIVFLTETALMISVGCQPWTSFRYFGVQWNTWNKLWNWHKREIYGEFRKFVLSFFHNQLIYWWWLRKLPEGTERWHFRVNKSYKTSEKCRHQAEL